MGWSATSKQAKRYDHFSIPGASSQDVLYMAFPEPATKEGLDFLREQCDELRILQDHSIRPQAFEAYEYPKE